MEREVTPGGGPVRAVDAGGRRVMARDRWLFVEENGDLWLLKREGHELHGRIVSREGLRHEFPRLYAELVASNNKDTPRVVVER